MKPLLLTIALLFSLPALALGNGLQGRVDGNKEVIANFVIGKMNGWTATYDGDDTYYIKYLNGSILEGEVIRNGLVKIRFKQNNVNNVLGAIYLSDGRVFKGKFDLRENSKFGLWKLSNQKLNGVITYPTQFKERKYYGKVEFWRGKEVDRDGFGVVEYENGKLASGDYIREFVGKSQKINPASSAIVGVLTLGLSTVSQASDRLSQEKLIREMKAIENEVNVFLDGFSYEDEVMKLEVAYYDKSSKEEEKKTNLEMKKYKSQCKAFGYVEFNKDGSPSSDFNACVKEAYFKAEELRVLKSELQNKKNSQTSGLNNLVVSGNKENKTKPTLSNKELRDLGSKMMGYENFNDLIDTRPRRTPPGTSRLPPGAYRLD